MEEEIPFNYFHQLFLRNIQKMKVEKAKSQISQDDEIDIVELLLFTKFSKEEMLAIFNEILLNICEGYMTPSNSESNILPNDPFEFINLILNTEEENPYRDSFLKSLPHIYQEYFACLGIGVPILMGSFDKDEDTVLIESSDKDEVSALIENPIKGKIPCFTIHLNHQYQIQDFYIENIELLEQAKIMTKIVSMEVKGQIGPVPKVRILIKPDPTLKVISQ